MKHSHFSNVYNKYIYVPVSNWHVIFVPMETFDFRRDYILENERARLRPLSRDDMDALLPFSLREPEIWTFSQQPANGKRNLESYLAQALQERVEQKAYPFIVYDKLVGEVAGSTRFYDFQQTHHTVQLGYTWFGKKYQGTGLNKQCKLLMLEFAFERLGLDRVEFRADAKNARSIAAMKSIGCIEEGILRNNCAAPNGRRDSIVLSILKNEWLGGTRQNLETKIEKEKKLSPR